MAEYIEREAAYQALTEYYHHTTVIQHEALREALAKIPAADVQPVVYCKDCKHSYDSVGGLVCSHGVAVDCIVPEEFFCVYGEQEGVDG